MLWLKRVTLRARALLLRDRTAREVDDELRYHVDRQVSENVSRGMSEDAARTAALRAFGGVQRFKEEVREEHGLVWLDQLRQDLAYAFRAAVRTPGFTAIVIATLGLGIGATTAIFSVVSGILLRDLPFESPDRLVRMWIANPTRDALRSPVSVPEVEDWRRLATSFDAIAGYSTVPTGLALADGEGEPVRLQTAYVTQDFFRALGVRPRVGRAILPAEHVAGRDRVVVLSHRLWQARYAGSPNVIGRTLRMNDEPYTVVGVMPPDARFPDRGTEIWVPSTVVPETGVPRTRNVRWLSAIGRLKPGVSPERGRADMDVVAKRLANEFADTNAEWTATTVVPLRDEMLGKSRAGVLVLFGAVILTLVLACVNVANLVLARSSRRAREMAVRTALGAARSRLARQLFTESIGLTLAGGVLGVALAAWGVRSLVGLIGPWLPAVGDVRVDGTVLVFALGVSALTGVAFGLIPVANGKADVAGTLRESGRGNTGAARSHAFRRALVALEVGLAMMLVVGAGLLVKSFARLSQVALGYEVENALYVRLTIQASRYASSRDYLPVAYRMLDQVRQVPGLTAVALVKDGPMRAGGEESGFVIPAQAATLSGDTPRASFLPSSDGVLRALGVRLEAGRDLTYQDGDSGTAGVVISASLARKHWAGRSPIGEEIEVQRLRLRVVGVAGDVRYTSVQGEPLPIAYVSNRLVTRRIFTVVARTAGEPTAMLASVRDAIRTVERDQPITEIGPMRDAIGDAVAAPRVLTLLVGSFGAIALLLAAIGVYGVVAYVVGQRTNEIGIRIALGAQSSDIVGWTLRTGLAPALVGLAVGAIAAFMMSRVLGAQLYQVSPKDPAVFAGVAGVLVIIALLASAVPARRAARVHPAVALRSE